VIVVPLALSQPLAELVALRLQAIGEPTRIHILGRLERGRASVQELTDQLATTHQNVSKHLRVLYGLGIVSRSRDGNKVWYSLADYSACRLLELAAGSVTSYAEDLAAVAEAS
jgi:DNA-binding transcriptional ArsR family regulator